MKLRFETDEALGKAIEQIAAMATPDERVLIGRLRDGAYAVIGRVVKDPDCPQEDFDFAVEQLVNTCNQ